MKHTDSVYYIEMPDGQLHGTRHGSPFRSKPHAETVVKHDNWHKKEGKVVEFKLMRVQAPLQYLDSPTESVA